MFIYACDSLPMELKTIGAGATYHLRVATGAGAAVRPVGSGAWADQTLGRESTGRVLW